MREFWQDIMDRWLRTKKYHHRKLSLLERLIWQECASPEEELRLHDHKIRLMMEEIQKRAADAKRYGDGEADIKLAYFESSLRRQQRRNRERFREMEVYELLRQGLPREAVCEKLNISGKQAIRAEKSLILRYNVAGNQTGETPWSRRMDPSPILQTTRLLQESAWRVLRQDTTGAVQYRFYHRDRLIGTASALVCPGFPVILRQDAVILNSSFDPEQTIVPGLSREIVDADNISEPVARLTWKGSEGYELTRNLSTGPRTIRILSQGEEHQFWLEDRKIARICPLPVPQTLSGWEMHWCMQSFEDLTEDMGLLLMSFPLLRFAR